MASSHGLVFRVVVVYSNPNVYWMDVSDAVSITLKIKISQMGHAKKQEKV
jgi:hypothetical protein